MDTPSVTDVRSFIPAKDYKLSLSFYEALGWKKLWGDDGLTLMELGNHRIYVQNAYKKLWAHNTMLHISVENAEEWKELAEPLVDQIKGVRIRGPIQEPYGAKVIYVWDPSGVLLHFAEWDEK